MQKSIKLHDGRDIKRKKSNSFKTVPIHLVTEKELEMAKRLIMGVRSIAFRNDDESALAIRKELAYYDKKIEENKEEVNDEKDFSRFSSI